jgi:hypothetical protein
MTRVTFEGEKWFAWFPVYARGAGWVWLATVYRERIAGGDTAWRYYF